MVRLFCLVGNYWRVNTAITKDFPDKIKRLRWWQLALLSLAISSLGALSGGADQRSQRKVYRRSKQAPWAPPGWLFAPAWTFNNFCLLLGIRQMMRKGKLSSSGRLLAVQISIWFIFFSFNYVYFKKRSPVLAAVWTNADAVLALTGLVLTYKQDRKAALSYAPLLLWTAFASTLADYQAWYNDDPLLHTKALRKKNVNLL